ncbi:hypothetical protein H6G64_35355 [Calothrix sp. FACHB-156]|nr:hypothetical protein [Calothrix sp. FACHB-156]
MTDTNSNNEDIKALIAQLAQSQLETNRQIKSMQQAIINTQDTVQELTSDVNRILSRSAVLDDVVLQLQENQQMMQANFNEHQRTLEEYRRDFIEHQRTTNAALNSLEAINLRLIEIISRG